MNSPTTELNTTLSKQEYVGTDDPSSRDCSSEKDTTVHNGPAGTSFWTVPSSDASLSGILPHPHQHTIQPRVVDPLSLRYYVHLFTIFLLSSRVYFECVFSFLVTNTFGLYDFILDATIFFGKI